MIAIYGLVTELDSLQHDLPTKSSQGGMPGPQDWTRTNHRPVAKQATPMASIFGCKKILQKLAFPTPARSWTTSLKWTTYRRFANMYRRMCCTPFLYIKLTPKEPPL